MSAVVSIAALLIGSGLLLLAGGLHGLLLPLAGLANGFSDASLGLLGTGWAAGYVSGCLAVPVIVKRVGHVRAFGALASLAGISVLLNLLFMDAAVWIVLRAITGFCFSGAAMIVESWLNERSTSETRGRIFGIYTMINLGATTAGQMLLTLGDPSGFFFFVLGSIIYSLSLLPTALSTAASPQPLTQARLDPKKLWRNSPIAVVAVFMVGISNGSFGTLGAVYGLRIGLDVPEIAIMMSLALLAGAVLQIPVGMLSDRLDRRLVLVGLAITAMSFGSSLSFFGGIDPTITVLLIAGFGGVVYSMYPVIVAHASDHAEPGDFLRISGGLLLIFGAGTMVGPLLASGLMTFTYPGALFQVTAAAHLSMMLFALWRMRQRASLSQEDKSDFVMAVSTAQITTPETVSLDPRTEVDETGGDI
ncbi:MFS transporter [Roseibium aggregatum]|uniref:Membrane protein, major facilitator transporter family protein n=1 Tax=Roseibium aggregatum (strain ATCC 25650 / DSM 13394 / JCM 20685 / NBRC 16684 / NCIMB 2208 / IAM 12614 / B1) TaxID=384765 RepID=A0NS78_ROSAI|nr:MFS transporter [Roseibium aggregatum]EAV44407.1 membrane protein, major facilitator transporter family protein [Roseibium aggregatum IAM 12614]